MELLLYENGSHWWGGGIVFLIFALILGFLIFKVFFFRGGWGPRYWAGGPNQWPDTSPEAILKRRLAQGEITEADYHHLREVLDK